MEFRSGQGGELCCQAVGVACLPRRSKYGVMEEKAEVQSHVPMG
jgi:hypothetical protein